MADFDIPDIPGTRLARPTRTTFADAAPNGPWPRSGGRHAAAPYGSSRRRSVWAGVSIRLLCRWCPGGPRNPGSSPVAARPASAVQYLAPSTRASARQRFSGMLAIRRIAAVPNTCRLAAIAGQQEGPKLRPQPFPCRPWPDSTTIRQPADRDGASWNAIGG